jgi:hypothetical protein
LPLAMRTNPNLILSEERELEFTDYRVLVLLTLPAREGNDSSGFRNGVVDAQTIASKCGISNRVVGEVYVHGHRCTMEEKDVECSRWIRCCSLWTAVMLVEQRDIFGAIIIWIGG